MADENTSNPPRNFSEDINDYKVYDCGVMAVDDDSEVGLLTILTPVGHYDFLINQEVANQIVQHLRKYIRGDSDKLPDA
jgi:H2-forming N5,N10-methylenetetrahydromethanopterin dehydrogenase-like enzyme